MFAKLTGKIDDIFEDSIILDVNFVGYKIFTSKKNLDQLRSSNENNQSFILKLLLEKIISIFMALLQLKNRVFLIYFVKLMA